MRLIIAFIFLMIANFLSAQLNEAEIFLSTKSGNIEYVDFESSDLPRPNFYDINAIDAPAFDPIRLANGDYRFEFKSFSNYTGNTEIIIEYYSNSSSGVPIANFSTMHIAVKPSKITAVDDNILVNSSNSSFNLNPISNDSSTDGDLTLVNIGHAIGCTATINGDGQSVDVDLLSTTGEIHYFVEDSLGTVSSSKIHILEADDTSVESYDVFTDNKNPLELRLTSTSFVVNVSPNHGSLTNPNSDHIWYYLPDDSFSGTDYIEFTTANGGVISYNVEIISKVSNASFVVDDEVFIFNSGSGTFDVLSNDLRDNITVIYHSSELTMITNGVFEYTPTPGFIGDEVFEYKVLSGTTVLTGYINVHVNDFAPVNLSSYSFDIIEEQDLRIEHQSPVSGYTFELTTDAANGSVTILDSGQQFINECDTIEGDYTIIYTTDSGYTGLDEFDIEYCSPTNVCEIVKVQVNITSSNYDDCICIENCVYQGDHNDDGRVNVLDILDLGLNVGEGGNTRSDDFTEIWAGLYSTDWGYNQINSKVDLKCGDADGNGYVDAVDLDYIDEFYGNTSRFQSSHLAVLSQIPVTFIPQNPQVDSGEVLFLDVNIGNESFPGIDMHGLTFSLNLSSELMDSSSVNFELIDNNWLSYNTHTVAYNKVPYDGRIEVAASRIGKSSVDGYGTVGILSFIVEDELTGFRRERLEVQPSIIINVTDITSVNGFGEYIKHPDQTIEVPFRISDSNSKEITEVDFEESLSVYPNPTDGIININSDIDVLDKVEIYDVTGKLVTSLDLRNHYSQQVDLSSMNEGVYILKVIGENFSSSQKVFKL